MQLPLIRALRWRGYKVLVTDGNPECPGARLAGQYEPLSTYDVHAHQLLAEQLTRYPYVARKPVAVLTAGADVGPTVSAVAEVLGLPAASLETATRCRNKALMRAALGAERPVWLGMPFNEADPPKRWEDRAWASNAVPYPCVVKPLEEAGSRGVSTARDAFGLRRAIKHAQAADRQGHDFCLVEQLLRGPDVATDFFVEDGELVFAGAAWRFFRRDRFGHERGHVALHGLPVELLELAQDAARKLGVERGPFKLDVKRDDRYGWCVLEAATRLSGGFDHMGTGAAIGRDATGVMIDVALGGKVDRGKLEQTDGVHACALAPDLEPGPVKEWRLDAARSHPGMRDVVVLCEEVIPPPQHCAARPVFVIAAGQSWREAVRRAVEAGRKVEVVYAEPKTRN